jgi:hypothetical protein
MVEPPADPSGRIDEREHASVMRLLVITIRAVSAALLAVAARIVVDGPTLAYGITAAGFLTMLLAAVWLHGIGRRLPATVRANGGVSRPHRSLSPNLTHTVHERPTTPLRDS